jgi:hypothetical protein
MTVAEPVIWSRVQADAGESWIVVKRDGVFLNCWRAARCGSRRQGGNVTIACLQEGCRAELALAGGVFSWGRCGGAGKLLVRRRICIKFAAEISVAVNVGECVLLGPTMV